MGSYFSPNSGGGLLGGCALALALCGLVVAFIWRQLARPRGIEVELLIQQAVWAVGMTLAFGLAIASIRKSTGQQPRAAYLALCISLLGIGCIFVRLVSHLLW